MKPALSPEEWAAGEVNREGEWGTTWEKQDGERFLVVAEWSPITPPWIKEADLHALAALCLHKQEFGFTREMLNGIRTLIYETGGGAFCPKCASQDFGAGADGEHNICQACGWHPGKAGTERGQAERAAALIEALIPPEGTS